MAIPTILPCDGCGQLASADHLARRLQRLEWATRFRPIHIQALLLSAAAPESDAEFLYSPESHLAALAGQILAALDIQVKGKSLEEILSEFQRRGLVFASVLECPVEESLASASLQELLERHLPRAIARIRRSLKPRRVLIISPQLHPFLPLLSETALGCPVFYTPLDSAASPQGSQPLELASFRKALPAVAAHST